MGNYNTVFRQMLNMIPRSQFEYEARKGGYNRYTKHFTVWNQFFVNLYNQASGKTSLREIEYGLRVQYSYWYHLGLKNISRSQLAYVNKKRSYTIFENLYYRLFSRCTDMAPKHKFKFNNPLHILDSTLISLCLSVFPWAKFVKRIELFFKWIKQNLKIKTFLGTSKNAVMTQIWTAMIYYLLLSYIKYQTKYSYSLLKFTRIIKEALFKKMDIIDLLSIDLKQIKKAREPCTQRLLFDLDEFY